MRSLCKSPTDLKPTCQEEPCSLCHCNRQLLQQPCAALQQEAQPKGLPCSCLHAHDNCGLAALPFAPHRMLPTVVRLTKQARQISADFKSPNLLGSTAECPPATGIDHSPKCKTSAVGYTQTG